MKRILALVALSVSLIAAPAVMTGCSTEKAEKAVATMEARVDDLGSAVAKVQPILDQVASGALTAEAALPMIETWVGEKWADKIADILGVTNDATATLLQISQAIADSHADAVAQLAQARQELAQAQTDRDRFDVVVNAGLGLLGIFAGGLGGVRLGAGRVAAGVANARMTNGDRNAVNFSDVDQAAAINAKLQGAIGTIARSAIAKANAKAGVPKANAAA